MKLRRATMDDALDVLAWRNDPHTIAMSRTAAAALDQTAHVFWFAKAIADPNRELFIATEDGRRLGMVRFDKLHDGWLVSINLSPAERGKGYGGKVLKKALAAVRPRRLLAEIKADNIASIHIFERYGFRQIGSKDGFLHFELSR
jgi:RimJ/RimL family protein N-acetyltransferase